tara:strand:- start:313 stop:522 length:210 start_codon:yes stop_codon:yes gene_type:complete
MNLAEKMKTEYFDKIHEVEIEFPHITDKIYEALMGKNYVSDITLREAYLMTHHLAKESPLFIWEMFNDK